MTLHDYIQSLFDDMKKHGWNPVPFKRLIDWDLSCNGQNLTPEQLLNNCRKALKRNRGWESVCKYRDSLFCPKFISEIA